MENLENKGIIESAIDFFEIFQLIDNYYYFSFWSHLKNIFN